MYHSVPSVHSFVSTHTGQNCKLCVALTRDTMVQAKSIDLNIVFPRNPATVRFNFKTLYHVATIRGWLDFEGSTEIDTHKCTQLQL